MTVAPSSAAPTRSRVVAIAVQPVHAVAALALAGFAVRLWVVFGRELQRYLPDEYLYGQLARSIADGHGARVLGEPVALPTLMQPYLTAPTWLFGDPELAFRLTQGLNAAAMSLGAVVVYTLARDLRVPAWAAVGAAAVAIVSPGLLYSGYVTADAIGYLLALVAVRAAVRSLSKPSVRTQGWFLAMATLATFARAQYAALFFAAAAASVIVEHAKPRPLLTRHLLILGTPFLAAIVVVATGRLGRYGALASWHVSPASLQWLAATAFMLALAVGAVLVPGAAGWLTHTLANPASRTRSAYAAMTLALIGVLIAASALTSVETGSGRFFERYLLVAAPLLAIAFCLWVDEGCPGRYVAVGTAIAIAIAIARIPLSEYSAGQGRADSPLLLALGDLEVRIGVGSASLVVALTATGCLVLGVAAAFNRVSGRSLIVVAVAVGCVASFGAHAADRSLSHDVRAARLGPNRDWVDRLGQSDVLLMQTAGGDQSGAMLLTLHNQSITQAALLGQDATPFDGAIRRLHVSTTGRVLLDGSPVRRPLVAVETATQLVWDDSTRLGQFGDFTLVRPRGDARLAISAEGLYRDGWLSGSGSITVFGTAARSACRHATLALSLPSGFNPVPIEFGSDHLTRTIVVRSGRVVRLPIQASTSATTLSFRAPSPRLVSAPSLRALSVRAHVSSRTGPCSSGLSSRAGLPIGAM